MTSRSSLQSPQRNRWSSLLWLVPSAIVALAVVVLVARWMREIPAIESFLIRYPGASAVPDGTPTGIPPWLSWQHFLNAFFIVLVVRSGWLVRTTKRPPAYWTRRNSGTFRTRSQPTRISLYLWAHLTIDVLWVVNGIVFIVLLFATGQWLRIVPTNWDVFPNALSSALQYASLQWPTENGWLNYNSLQVLSYFVTVFIAAPLAAVSGLRMSPAWPAQSGRLSALIPIAWARAIHFPVMLFFVAFVIVHVTLVLATGAQRNLNHMFAAQVDAGWMGFWMFAVSLVVMAAGWLAIRPTLLRPIAALSGTVTR